TVSFSAQQGSLTGDSPTTNSSGVATVGSWTLGTVSGQQQVSATASGVTFPAVFYVNGKAAAPNLVQFWNGCNQNATVGTTVGLAPLMLVSDVYNNRVSGATIVFTIAFGNGSLTGATQTTDESGTAQVGSWTLGTTAGTQTLQANAGSVYGTCDATAKAGAAASISLLDGNNQTGPAGGGLPNPTRVIVKD